MGQGRGGGGQRWLEGRGGLGQGRDHAVQHGAGVAQSMCSVETMQCGTVQGQCSVVQVQSHKTLGRSGQPSRHAGTHGSGRL